MRVLPFTIPKSKNDVLIVQEDKGISFYELLHQHEEIQISQIIEGKGTLIVGDTFCEFNKNDIFVLGGNLPHVFKNELSTNSPCHMQTVFFTKQSFGAELFAIEELKPLQSFFIKAENGFRVKSNTDQTSALLSKLYHASKIDRFIVFFQLLRSLNKSKYEKLSSFVIHKKYSDMEGKRMNAVFDYTMNHFHEKITLSTIAQQATMSKNAFCKYFKKRTNKTYTSFLNEFRIEKSCKRLRGELEVSISEIAEQCGFQNISNFNRRFKQFKGITPRSYRKEIQS